MIARNCMLIVVATIALFTKGCMTTPSVDVALPATPAPSTSTPTSPVGPAATAVHAPTPSQPHTPPQAVTPTLANQMVEMARLDLSHRFSAPLSAVRLVKVYPDEFPIDNLGCPDPSITPRPVPAIVSGEVIVLEINGLQYAYHTRKEALVFCGKLE